MQVAYTSQVSIVVADGLALTWHQVINNHHYGADQFSRMMYNVYLLRTKTTLDKTAPFQKGAMRTQVALYFLWSEICIE